MGDITNRTAWFNRARRPDKNVIQFLPFYTVIVDGFVGRMIEPVDCLKRRSFGTSESSMASRFAVKEVNEMKELFSGRQADLTDEVPGQDSIALHSFGWEWPL